MKSADNLIWIDLEMTGLDPETCRIIEAACLITDKELNVIAESPVLVIHQTEEVLNSMNAWCVHTHTKNGLIDRVRASTLTEAEAEEQLLAFVRKYVLAGQSPLCGNSVSQDRRFLYRYMPKFESYLHYRHLDVSTLKILCQKWKPEVLALFAKKESHQALDDIHESIEELKFYRQHILTI